MAQSSRNDISLYYLNSTTTYPWVAWPHSIVHYVDKAQQRNQIKAPTVYHHRNTDTSTEQYKSVYQNKIMKGKDIKMKNTMTNTYIGLRNLL